jgi:oxygen-dependent protoporphyrinogen oxidase
VKRVGHWAVIGGGVSGIAAAHFLARAGIGAEIVERDRALGGRIGAREMNGRPVELGGKNIGRGYRLFREFVASVGDHRYEHIGMSTTRVENGQLKTIDSSRRWRSFLTQLSRRSPRDLLRFLRMALSIKLDEREGYLGGSGFRRLAARKGDPAATAYFTRSFCQEALRPMSLLMNAAEPDEIHLGNLGTNVRMVLDDYDQLQHGMGRLLARFGARAATRLDTTVEALRVEHGRVVGLRVVGPSGQPKELAYDGVILATTAHAAADLLAPHLPGLASALRRVRYFPTAVVVAEYEKNVFNPEVRALRFDEDDPLSSARAYGKTTLNVVRYTFSGRAARPFLEGAIDADALLRRGETSLGRVLPVSNARRRAFVAPERAFVLSAYSQHHAERLDDIARAARGLLGLHLTGDYLRGASIEACFRAAKDCVDALAPSIPKPGRHDV